MQWWQRQRRPAQIDRRLSLRKSHSRIGGLVHLLDRRGSLTCLWSRQTVPPTKVHRHGHRPISPASVSCAFFFLISSHFLLLLRDLFKLCLSTTFCMNVQYVLGNLYSAFYKPRRTDQMTLFENFPFNFLTFLAKHWFLSYWLILTTKCDVTWKNSVDNDEHYKQNVSTNMVFLKSICKVTIGQRKNIE